MLRKIREAQKNEEGFTLIELLVVVIIIGILAAIAIPMFLNQRQRGYQAGLTSDVRNSAIEVEAAFTSSGGTYPGALPAVELSSAGTTLSYTSNTEGFCIVGIRDDLDGYVLYDSLNGGVQTYVDLAGSIPTTASCVAPTATVPSAATVS